MAKKENKIKKAWLKIPETVKIAIVVFSFVVPSWIILTILIRRYLNIFGEGLLIEAFGMLLDILVIGIVILWLNEKREKRRQIQRWMEEIDDFRGWKSDEAKFRIVGNIKRLNRNGVTKIDLSQCFLKKADLMDADLQGADLDISDLRGAVLQNANLRGANLIMAKLQNAVLTCADLQSANFEAAKLQNTVLAYANLLNTNFEAANLQGADLEGANLQNAILEGASLQDSILEDANLQGIILTYANLKGTNFAKADLQCAIFGGYRRHGLDEIADLSRAILKGYHRKELGGGADLRDAKNLTVEQLSKVKTLYNVKLDPSLERQIKEKYPKLLEEPNEE